LTEAELIEALEDGTPDIEDIVPLFEKSLSLSSLNFIIIDAIDECSRKERETLLAVLRSTMDSTRSTVKVFIASRPDLDQEIKRVFDNPYHTSMNSSGLQRDITSYVKDVVTQMILNGELIVGNVELIVEIQDALIEGAQGMFVLFVPIIYTDIEILTSEGSSGSYFNCETSALNFATKIFAKPSRTFRKVCWRHMNVQFKELQRQAKSS